MVPPTFQKTLNYDGPYYLSIPFIIKSGVPIVLIAQAAATPYQLEQQASKLHLQMTRVKQ